MQLECRWCYARKRWSWEFEIFEKETVKSWGLRLYHVGRELSSLPWSRVVRIRPLSQSWVFLISTGRDELRSKKPWDLPNVGGVVSIVWLRKTFKNFVSILVSKDRSQKFVLNNWVRLFTPAFVYLTVYAFVYVPLWLISSRYTTFIQASMSFIQVSVTFIHGYVSFIKASVSIIHNNVLFIDTCMSSIKATVSFIWASKLFMHATVLFI